MLTGDRPARGEGMGEGREGTGRNGNVLQSCRRNLRGRKSLCVCACMVGERRNGKQLELAGFGKKTNTPMILVFTEACRRKAFQRMWQ